MIEIIPGKKYYGKFGVGTVVLVDGNPNHFTGPDCGHAAKGFATRTQARRDWKARMQYGKHSDGTTVPAPPEGWEIIPEGEEVPSAHMNYDEDYSSGHRLWCAPRRCRSTMTPMEACVSGSTRAIARKTTP